MRYSVLLRIFTYLLYRTFVVGLTVGVGVYLAILAINFGGFVDDIFRGRITDALMGMSMSMQGTPIEEQRPILDAAAEAMAESFGLNDPFLLRTLRFLQDGLTLNWGDSQSAMTATRDRSVQAVILERLPNTLLLAGSANLLLFGLTILGALYLSRRYGGLMDRALVILAPLSSAPSWIYGAILITLFAVELNLFPISGMTGSFPPDTRLGYGLMVARHMVLPVAAIVLGTLFQGIYAWRTFFLLQSQEDYVEMAHAKGLPGSLLERRYILRPAMPAVLTSFSLMVVGFWQNALALEVLFRWPGIGPLFLTALFRVDRPVTIAVIVTFAYLLGISLLVLDIVYALVDPRVRIAQPPSLRQMGRSLRTSLANLSTRRWARRPTAGWMAGIPAALAGLGRRVSLPGWSRWKEAGQGLAAGLAYTGRLLRSPAAALGMIIILALVGVSLYTVVTIPYSQAVTLWRAGGDQWSRYPKNVPPAWTNLFRQDPLPETRQWSSRDDPSLRQVASQSQSSQEVTFTFTFDYPYAELPQEVGVFLRSNHREKQPFVSITWQPPGEPERELTSLTLRSSQAYYVSQDQRLSRRLRQEYPLPALFRAGGMERDAQPSAQEAAAAQPGEYTLRVRAILFEPETELHADLVLYGAVHGWAGTDHQRRDLMVAMLWGAPVALIFGLIGAVVTTLVGMLLAASAAWLGGWLDALVQWLTGINLILPTLPLAMTIYFVYGKSVWLMLGVIVLLSIFGGHVKQYRAFFLQVKEVPYLEAARVYGTGHARMILRYLVPRLLPVVIPQMVLMVPGFIFLEATLAFLGVSDIYIPTWGKVLHQALTIGSYRGSYYWIFQPLLLLMLTGFAFSLLGLALDKAFNPRLQDR